MRVGFKPHQQRFPVRPLWAQYDALGLRLAFVYARGSEARSAPGDQSLEPSPASFSAAAASPLPFSPTPPTSRLAVLQLHSEAALGEALARRAAHASKSHAPYEFTFEVLVLVLAS